MRGPDRPPPSALRGRAIYTRRGRRGASLPQPAPDRPTPTATPVPELGPTTKKDQAKKINDFIYPCYPSVCKKHSHFMIISESQGAVVNECIESRIACLGAMLEGGGGGGAVALRGLAPGRASGPAGAVALRGLAPGRASRPARAADLLAAAALADADPRPIYVDVDAEGYLVPAGARGGAAALLARARLAPGGAALEPCGAGAWRVAVRAPLAPHAELLVWPRADLLQRAAVPPVAAHNKLESGRYVCHRCGWCCGAPHALRVHLFLACAAPGALLFWTTLLGRLEGAGAGAGPHTALEPALEALAAAWGRGAGGGAGHACVFCGRLYSRRYGLKIHLRTHTGYKPLRCPHCRRAFGDPSNLNKHVKLHGAAPGAPGAPAPHGCALCGKALVRRRDLERHMRARHAAPAPAPARNGRPTEIVPAS